MKGFIVANNIRSAYNVGSIFRIADSIQFSVILQGFSPYPRIPNDTRPEYLIERCENKIKKSAVRTFDKVSYSYYKDPIDVISFLQANNVSIYSLEITPDSMNIYDLSSKDVSKPFALVLGNEVNGVDKEYLEKSEKILHIPMYGSNGSLNVSVSAGVALFHLIHI